MKIELRRKYLVLFDVLNGCGDAAVAFSGGVDSAVVLAAAADALENDNVIAITACGDFFPKRETAEARKIAKALKVKHVVFDAKPLSNPALKNNPPNRCYHCKKATFKKIIELADANGIANVMDGANLDDEGDYRPGAAAADELEIIHPLVEAGIGKNVVRELAREYALPNAGKPASACLATRFPFGAALDKKSLRRVEKSEQALIDMGFKIVRVRSYGDLARIEVPIKDLKKIFSRRAEISDKLIAAGFKRVTVDLAGFRSGSMNEEILKNGR